MQTDKIQILHCPFCGESPIINNLEFLNTYSGKTIYRVHCNKCESCGPKASNSESAISLWNQRSRKGKKVEQLEILPLELNTPDFKQAWDEWLNHLREKKKFPTPSVQRKHLKSFLSWGEKFAIDVIDHSIKNNWQAPYPPKYSQQIQISQDSIAHAKF